MAFLNYLGLGTYTIIDYTRYEKQGKNLTWTLRIYADASKTDLLAYREFNVCSSHPIQRILGKQNTPPPIEQRSIDDMWLVGDDPEGDWQDFEDHAAKWNGVKWEFWQIGAGQTFYDLSRDCYIARNVDNFDFMELEYWTDYWSWEKWFAPSVIYGPDTNLVRQIYLYLKSTKKAFANVIDV